MDPENPNPSADPVEPTAAPSADAPVVETPTDEPPKGTFKAIASQEDLDRIIQERLARDRKARGDKLGDHNVEELLEAKNRLDEIEREKAEAEREKLGDIEKRDLTIKELTEQLESLKGELSKRDFEKLRSDVASEVGLPDYLVGRLKGETKEELEADARELLAAIKPKKAPSERPEPLGGGAPAQPDSAGFDPAKKAEELISRGY